MVADIITAIAGPAVGGIIAAAAGWKVAVDDRKREREERRKQWHMSVFRLAQELNESVGTVNFMKLSNDRQRLKQEFAVVAEQLAEARYNAPSDVDQELLSAMQNTGTNARRLENGASRKAELYHYKMLEYAQEIQYHLQSQFGEDLPAHFKKERMDKVEDRIETRNEMSTDEWQVKESKRFVKEMKRQRKEMEEEDYQLPDSEILNEYREEKEAETS